MSEVCVIGGGPAGSVAATLLAREGWNVTLLEQQRFPRDKVCGECLSWLGIQSLQRVGLLEPVRACCPAVLTRAMIHCGHGTHAIALPRPMWGLSRASLDMCLLDAARGAGAKVVQPARLESIENKPLRLRVRRTGANRVEMLSTEWVLLSDGKTRGNGVRDFGIKAHFQSVHGPRDAIGLFACRGLYGGLAPIEGDRWNVAFSVPARRLGECRGDIDRLFGQLRLENEQLGRKLSGARRVSDWLAAPSPRRGVRADWPERVIPLGNAAAAIEPVGGEGMGLAIRSAELAARCLCDGGDVNRLRREYQRLWTTRSFACRAAARVICSRSASRLLLPLLDVAPRLTDLALSLLGKAAVETASAPFLPAT